MRARVATSLFSVAGARVRMKQHHAPLARASSNVSEPHMSSPADAGDGVYACCARCRGEGATFSLSKAQRKRRNGETEEQRAVRMSPDKRSECAECAGSGVTLGTPRQPSTSARVAIIGGGIGGAALALALQQRGVASTVYERDARFEARKQGYGLTMQKYSGGAALRSLGLRLRGVGSDAHVSLASNGRVLGRYGHSERVGASANVDADDGEQGAVAEAKSDEKRNVHMPRQKLRQSLLEALNPGTVEWNKKFDRYEQAPGSDEVVVYFEDGSSSTVDVVVGADGIFSRVRAQKLGDDPLSYLGVIVVLGICRGTSHELCKNKVFQVVDGENRMYAMPFTASPDGDGCIPPIDGFNAPVDAANAPGAMMWQLSFPVTEDEAKAFSADPKALRDEALRRCGSWPEPVGELLAQTREDCMAGYPAYDRDMTPAHVLRGDASSLVTLIGDAAHPMSPFKGQGANQALLDAVHLARCIVRTPKFLLPGERRYGNVRPFETTSDALADAERAMLQRSKGKVTKSRDAAKYLHSPAALAEGNCVRAHAAASVFEE